jgi:hypothetical protein
MLIKSGKSWPVMTKQASSRLEGCGITAVHGIQKDPPAAAWVPLESTSDIVRLVKWNQCFQGLRLREKIKCLEKKLVGFLENQNILRHIKF